MTLDPSVYIVHKESIERWILRKLESGPLDYDRETGKIATSSGVPIVAVNFFTGEFLNWPEHMKVKMESDMKFHHITEVVGYIK